MKDGSGEEPRGMVFEASGCRLLAESQLDEVHAASLEILHRTGVRILDPECVRLLLDAGCTLTGENTVHFPASVVEGALLSVPSRVVVSDRAGNTRLHLEGHQSYYGTGSDLPYVRDLGNGERRPSILSDVADAARLADSLPNLDFVMSMALPSDTPAAVSDRHSFLAMIENTVKPIVFTAWDEAGTADIVSMAELVAGGARKLALRPFIVGYLEPESPLEIPQTVIRKMLFMVDRGLPFVYAPGPMEGATAPVTPAGSLALGNAEILAGVAIAQVRRRGAPIIVGSGSGPLDMRNMVLAFAGPECMLHAMAIAQLAHRYRIPLFGFSGTESMLPDVQAGAECALWILWNKLTGANLIHDIGYIESGMTCSYEMVVICNEVIEVVRRLTGGIEISPETLALKTIDEIGPRGSYLEASHTMRHFREVWYPQVLCRERWREGGGPGALENAREIALRSISEHKPNPLPESIVEALREVVADSQGRSQVEAQ